MPYTAAEFHTTRVDSQPPTRGGDSGSLSANQSTNSSATVLEQGNYSNGSLALSLFSYSAMGGEIGSASEGDGGSWSGQSYSGSDSDGANSGNSANWSESGNGSYNNGSWSLSSYVLQGTCTDYMSSHAYETVVTPCTPGETGSCSDTFFRHDTTSSQLTCSYYQSGAMTAGNYANSSYSVNDTAAVVVTFKIPGDSNNWNVSATLQGNLAGATIGTTTSYSFTRQVGSDWGRAEDRADSPWYPTMRLFRQKAFRDWTGVFQEVAAALRAEVGTGHQTQSVSAVVGTSARGMEQSA